MPYPFEPRDLEAPRGERPARTPPDALAEAFEAWLEESDGFARREIGGSASEALYELARDHLRGLDVRPVEATTLLLQYAGSVTPDVGLFLSAAYALADDDVVFFDVETPCPVERLGYRLPEPKTLVVDADIGSTMAVESRGLVVNRARVGSYFGYSAGGAFVNAPGGSCLTAGVGAARAFVNLGEVRSRDASADPPRLAVGPSASGEGDGVVLTAADCSAIPGLDAYLDRLGEGLSGHRGSVRTFLEGLEPTPKRAVVAEVERLLDEAGVER